MNLFEFVSNMKELNSAFGLIGVLLLSLFLIVIILKMYFGMRKGTWRQLIHTGTTLLSAVISYIIADATANRILGSTDQAAIEDLIVKIEGIVPDSGEFLRKLLLSFDPKVFESIMLLPATLILIPILATLFFLIFNFLLKIIRAIVVKIINIKKAKNNQQRLFGALLGAVEALIWLMMITLPITGVIGLVDRAYDRAIEATEYRDNKELKRIHKQYLAPFTENPAFTFMDSCGAGALSNGIATVKIDGKNVNMRGEAVGITGIVFSELTDLKEADFKNLSDGGKESIESIIDGICDSPYLTTIVTGSFNNAGVILELGVVKYDKEGEFADIVDGFVGYLKTISKDTLREDLTTMKELYFTISDSGALVALEDSEVDLWTVLQDQRKEGNDAISRMIDILQSNERTSGLIKTITEVLITSLATQIETPDGTVITVTYDDLKNGMNDVLLVKQKPGETREEYMKNLSNALDNTLTEHGIKLEYEIVDSIAEYIDENYSSNEDFTDEEFNDVLLHYYDAYLEYLETGEIPDDLPEGINPDDFIPEEGGNGNENVDEDEKPGGDNTSDKNEENPDGNNGSDENNTNPDEGNGNLDSDVELPEGIVIPGPGDDNYDESIYIIVEKLIVTYPDGIPEEVFATLPDDVIKKLIEFGYGPK